MAGNNFSPEIYEIFASDNWWRCWGCGQSHANCLHHIFGRGNGTKSVAERSALNAAPMANYPCHLERHGYWRRSEGKAFLLKQTIARLREVGYVYNAYDHAFLAKYGKEIREGLKIKI